MSDWRIVDADGNELKYHVVCLSEMRIERDGTVQHRYVDHETGETTEHSEPLWSSPVRDVFAPWTWDLLDDALDPRMEGS